MATMNINIINPTINLFQDVREESNSCRTVFYFEIKTTPYATIDISSDLTQDELEYINISLKNTVRYRGGIWYYAGTGQQVTAASDGLVKVRVIIENHSEQTVMGGMNGCNDVNITIQDITNTETKSRRFNRCGGLSCDDFPPPEAVDDNYEVSPGGTVTMDVISNDKPNTSFGTIVPTIDSQTTNGTLEMLESNKIKYTHDGGATTTDLFTYYVTNSIGQDSLETATVNISVTESARVISPSTKIYLGFDDSGSMDSTLDDLNRLKTAELKDLLLEHYGDEATYNSNVNVVNIGDYTTVEHSLDMIDQLAIEDSIFIIFQDEAESDYHADPYTFSDAALEYHYDLHITSLNTKLDTLNKCNIVFVQIEGYSGYKSFLQAVENGTGAYAGNKGMSTRDNFKIKYDIKANNGAPYYRDIIKESLNELGFNI
jgi:hypothetical protein